MMASLAFYFLQVPEGHLEAALRASTVYSAAPEEVNRKRPVWGARPEDGLEIRRRCRPR